MMKPVFRLWAIIALSLALAPASLASEPGDGKGEKDKEKATLSASKGGAKEAAKPEKAEPGETAKPEGRAEAAPAPQQPRGTGAGAAAYRADRPWPPLPTTTGTLGLFTVETGDTLPRGSYSAAIYANKFSRSPGSMTILNYGLNFAYGLTDRVSGYIQYEPYRHIHISRPELLSLNAPAANPFFPGTMYRRLTPTGLPGYVEDYPFAARSEGGMGEFALGGKWSFLSEYRGDPVSFSVRGEVIIPTRYSTGALADNQTQTGQLNFLFGFALSKTWGETIQAAFNFSHRFTRDPRGPAGPLMTQADQERLGFGWLLFPYKRVQFMHEVSGVIFTGRATVNDIPGARDPIDSIAGFRLYPWRNVGLDLGFRQTFNLRSHGDMYGFVIKVSGVNWPEAAPPPNRIPFASCSADRASVYAGSGEVVRVSVQASDPDGDSLSYSWTASGGRVEGSGAEVRWNSAGTAEGVYTVSVRVDDGRGGTANCAVDIRVEPRPNRAPTMTCAADRSSVLVGERVRITATASDPDGDALTYSWRTNGGQIVGQGASVQLDTTGASPGRYTVTGRADDGRGGAADCQVPVTVQAPPPQPQASKINECTFRAANSARVDNACKRILDDVALRLQAEPRARVVIVGSADSAERRAAQVAGQRAANAKRYLESRGIAAGRIETRTAAAAAGAANRRVDIIWVPEGATY